MLENGHAMAVFFLLFFQIRQKGISLSADGIFVL